MAVFAFFLGILFFFESLILIPILCGCVFFVTQAWRFIPLFFLGFVWAYIHTMWYQSTGMPNTSVIPKAHISGTIVEIPQKKAYKTRFIFQITQYEQDREKTKHNTFFASPFKNHARALLQCYGHCPEMHAGERWQLQAKLKKPINYANPGSFDYAQQLAAQHIAWTGYINPRVSTRMSLKTHTWLESFREKNAQRIIETIKNPEISGIVQALTLGIGSAITPAQWDLFRHTGTTHLMVISGAHVGLVASLAFGLTSLLWRRSIFCCHWMPAQQAASILAIISASAYTLLSGSAIPAQRALIACLLFFSKNLLSRYTSSWQAWRYALAIVLLIEPHAVLKPGFYLSFGAALILLTTYHRFRTRGLQQILLMQCACFIGLLPLGLYWFSYAAVDGLLANLIAIPWVGYGIVPLSLLGMIGNALFHVDWVWVPAIYSTQYLLTFLTAIDKLAGINITWHITDLHVLLILTGITGITTLLWIRAYIPAVIIGALCILFPRHDTPKSGTAIIDVLDVGQGLSVVVRTAQHTLLYDTGVRFYRGGDMGRYVILPYLENRHISRIDSIVISHPDLDHRGGLESIQAHMPVHMLIGNRANRFRHQHNCHHTPPWNWDGVQFQFFPIRSRTFSRNNTSCVLRIATQGGSILLTGDIEKKAETFLIKKYGDALQSDILLLPHHGSKTSSSTPFLRTVAPQYGLISLGFDNRYHFPHPKSLARWQDYIQNNRPDKKYPAHLYQTSTCGMISMVLHQKGTAAPECYRKNSNAPTA